MTMMGAQDPRVAFFQQWLQAGQPDLEGIAGDLAKQGMAKAAGASPGTGPVPTGTEKNTPILNYQWSDAARDIGNFLKTPIDVSGQPAAQPNLIDNLMNKGAPGTGSISGPLNREVAMPSMEQALKKMEESIAGPSTSIPAPTPSAPTQPTPTTPQGPTEGAISQSLAQSPDQWQVESGAGVPTQPQAPKPKEEDAALSNYVAPTIQPQVPTQAGMGLKDEKYFLDQLEARRKAFPSTPEAALQTVGKSKEDFQLAKKSTIGTLLDGMMAGAVGLDYIALKDKKAKELKDIENDYLKHAMAKFTHEDQIMAAKMQMERTADEVKRAGLEKQANMMIQNMGPNPSPESIARIMSMLGAAWRTSDEYVNQVLTEKWNPSTGKYENLLLSTTERANLEIKAKIDSMKKLFPGMPDEWYGVMAVGGKWKEFMEDMASNTNFKLQKAIQEGRTEEALALIKKSREITQYTRNMEVASFGEMMQFIGKKLGLPPETVNAAIFAQAAMAHGGDKEIAELYLKGEYELAKEKIKAAAELGKNKPGDMLKGLDYRYRSMSTPLSLMFPHRAIELAKDPIMLDQTMDRIKQAAARVETGDQKNTTAEDIELYRQWIGAANQAVTMFPKALPLVEAMRSAGVMPNTFEGMQTLLKKVVLIDEGIMNPAVEIAALQTHSSAKERAKAAGTKGLESSRPKK